MTLAQILQLIGSPAIISAIVISIYNRLLKKKDDYASQFIKIDTLEEELVVIQQEITDIRDKELENDIAIKNLQLGQQALLRDRIVNLYNHYMEKGHMPIYAKESLDRMYDSYKKLGGNGVVESLMERLYNLPTEEKFE